MHLAFFWFFLLHLDNSLVLRHLDGDLAPLALWLTINFLKSLIDLSRAVIAAALNMDSFGDAIDALLSHCCTIAMRHWCLSLRLFLWFVFRSLGLEFWCFEFSHFVFLVALALGHFVEVIFFTFDFD